MHLKSLLLSRHTMPFLIFFSAPSFAGNFISLSHNMTALDLTTAYHSPPVNSNTFFRFLPMSVSCTPVPIAPVAPVASVTQNSNIWMQQQQYQTILRKHQIRKQQIRKQQIRKQQILKQQIFKPYMCPNCRKGFSHKYTLVRHLQTVCGKIRNPNGKWECPNHCGRRYESEGSLTRHVTKECGVPPQFRCVLCVKKPRYFTQQSSLIRHLKKKHPEENITDSKLKPICSPK